MGALAGISAGMVILVSFEILVKSSGINEGDLLAFMKSLDFYIESIMVFNGREFIGKKMLDSEEIIWFPIEEEGSGFVRLFGGMIKKAFKDKGV